MPRSDESLFVLMRVAERAGGCCTKKWPEHFPHSATLASRGSIAACAQAPPQVETNIGNSSVEQAAVRELPFQLVSIEDIHRQQRLDAAEKRKSHRGVTALLLERHDPLAQIGDALLAFSNVARMLNETPFDDRAIHAHHV